MRQLRIHASIHMEKKSRAEQDPNFTSFQTFFSSTDCDNTDFRLSLSWVQWVSTAETWKILKPEKIRRQHPDKAHISDQGLFLSPLVLLFALGKSLQMSILLLTAQRILWGSPLWDSAMEQKEGASDCSVLLNFPGFCFKCQQRV